MGWSIGYDSNWKRDIGYGVPALCDHPDCNKEIDRGLAYVCGGEPYGGEHGCGLFFCGEHRYPSEFDSEVSSVCEHCLKGEDPMDPKPDVTEWIRHKLKHPSWQGWRDSHPDEVLSIRLKLREVANATNS